MVKFGVSTYSICRKFRNGEMTPEQGIKWLAGQGAEIIEVVPFGIDLLEDETLAGKLFEAAKEMNVTIENYSLNANFLMITPEEYNNEIERAKRHMAAAQKLGISTFRLDCAAYKRPPEANTIENFQKDMPVIVETYKTICEFAKGLGITVLLENHGFHVNGSERVRQVLTSIDCENFGHQMDVGNFVCVDDIPEIAVKKMLPFAKTIHMKDFYIRPYDRDPGNTTEFDCSGAWFRSQNGSYLRGSILAQGDLDMVDIIKKIKQSGFEGNIFIEFEGMEDCLYGTKVSLDNLKRLYSEA